MPGHVTVANTRSEDVTRLLEEKLIPIMAGQPLAIAAAAMLMLIVSSMKPNIDGDELVACITDTSAFMVTWLSGLDTEQTVN